MKSSDGAIQHCPNCRHPLDETDDRVADVLNKIAVPRGYQFISCFFCRHEGVERLS